MARKDIKRKKTHLSKKSSNAKTIQHDKMVAKLNIPKKILIVINLKIIYIYLH
jgi:hypothetical protein